VPSRVLEFSTMPAETLPSPLAPDPAAAGREAGKLTAARVAKFIKDGLPEGKSSAMLWAASPKGLGLRLRKSSASWIYAYRPRGSGRSAPSRTVTIGRADSLTVKQAEAAAAQLAGGVAARKDPASERRAEKARSKTVLSNALDGFDASLRQQKIVAGPMIMSALRRELKPLMAREIDTIERREIVAVVDAIEARGRPGAARNLRKHAHALLEWAVTKGLLKHNVMAGLRRPMASRAERLGAESKGRALEDHEIARIWRAADELGAFGGLIRLALLTGLRRSELSGLTWTDVLADRLVIAAERAKTGARHEIPLTTSMRAILSAQPRTTSPLIFPGRSNMRMAGWSKLVPRAQRESGVDFRLHDLRRTVRTLMSRLGVSEETAELAIGHVRRGLIGTYNKDQAWASRADAFEKVSGHITQVVASNAAMSAARLPSEKHEQLVSQ
jgi:integrase